MKNDQRYIDLYVKMKRLMSLNARDNRHLYEPIQKQLKDLRDHGEVSEKVIELAPYMPWR
jgi:hypothetical protein